MRIALVGCGKTKLDRAAPARDLYTGQLFQKARQYAEVHCDAWYILSALHWTVSPSRVLEPYEARLDSRTKQQRLRLGLWSGFYLVLQHDRGRAHRIGEAGRIPEIPTGRDPYAGNARRIDIRGPARHEVGGQAVHD